MGKIETISKWSAHAALHSALEDVAPEEKVLILIEYVDGTHGVRSANITHAEAIYLMEHRKSMMFAKEDK